MTTFNRQSSAYVAYGNEASLGLAYGNICLVMRIGKVKGGVSNVVQLRKEWEEERRTGMITHFSLADTKTVKHYTTKSRENHPAVNRDVVVKPLRG